MNFAWRSESRCTVERACVGILSCHSASASCSLRAQCMHRTKAGMPEIVIRAGRVLGDEDYVAIAERRIRAQSCCKQDSTDNGPRCPRNEVRSAHKRTSSGDTDLGDKACSNPTGMSPSMAQQERDLKHKRAKPRIRSGYKHRTATESRVRKATQSDHENKVL